MTKSALAEIAALLAVISDQKLVEDFLSQILTPAEARELSSRWELVKMLEAEVPQREIAKRLKISLCKITRGSRELKKANNALKEFLKVKKNKNI